MTNSERSGRARPRTTNGRGERSRDAILRAAQEQFADRGYRGASLASVAEAAEISEPGLLHHFSSKSDLLLAVLERRDEEDGQRSSEHLGDEGIEIVEALEALVAHNQATPEPVRLFSVLLGESLELDHPAHDYFVHRYHRIRTRVARNLRRAETAEGTALDFDAEALATALIALMDGLQFQWLLDDTVDMAKSYGMIARLIVAALDPGQVEGQVD